MPDVCLVPYPDAQPASHDEIMAHCYRRRKCWWFEGACYCPDPSNLRDPHRPGVVNVMLTLPPEKKVGTDTIAACAAGRWRFQDYRSAAPCDLGPDELCNNAVIDNCPRAEDAWCDDREEDYDDE